MLTERAFAIKDDSPWEPATVLVNGVAVQKNAPVVLIRGKPNDVTVEGSPEIVKTLALALPEVEGLNIVASPALGDWVTPTNKRFNWTITPAAGKSGHALLVFYSRELVVSWEHKCAVLAADLRDEVASIKIGKYVLPASEMFLRDVPKNVEFTFVEGSPLNDLALEFEATAYSGTPPPVLEVSPSGRHAWQVVVRDHSGWISMILKSVGGGTIGVSLPRHKVLSGDLNDEVNAVLLDGVPYASDVVLPTEVVKTISLEKIGNSLDGHPLTLAVKMVTGGLRPEDIELKLVAAHRWEMKALRNTGTFSLELTGVLMSKGITLPVTRVPSSRLADAIDVQHGGKDLPSDNLVFLRNALQVLTIKSKDGSSFKEKVSLDWVSGDVTANDFKASPNFQEQSTNQIWNLTGPVDKEGSCILKFSCEKYPEPLTLPRCTVLDFKYFRNAGPIEIINGEGNIVVTSGNPTTLKLAAPTQMKGYKVRVTMSGTQMLNGPTGTIVHDGELVWSTDGGAIVPGHTQVFTFSYELIPDYFERITVRSIHH